jgi:hypothetical protein
MNNPIRVKPIRRALFSLGVLILTALLLWPPIYTAVSARRAAAYYRSNFAVSRPWGVVLHESEWALRFGGRAGLSQLRALSVDQTLKPSGRQLAVELHDYIDSGGHVTDIGEIFSMRDGWDILRSPLGSEYLGYLYFFDSLFSRKPPVTP